MRIAVVSPHSKGGYSGPAVLLRRLVDSLPSEVSVTIVGPRSTAGLGDRHDSVGIIRCDTSSRIGQVAWIFSSAAWILRNRKKFDILHFHGAYLYALIPALGAKAVGRPYFLFPLSAGGDLSTTSRGARIKALNWLRRSLVRGALGGFALAPEMQDELRHWGVDSRRTRIIGNAASDEFFKIGAINRKQRTEGRCLLFVGKLGERKSPHLILPALKELRREWPTSRAVFIGPFEDDSYGNRFRAIVAQLDLEEWVTVTGHVEDVASVVPDDASVFLLPSGQEGLPGALVEAMALGLPCGVSAVGAMGDVLGKAGGEPIARDSDSIFGFVNGLWRDSELWEKLSTSSFWHAYENFSREAVARTYCEALADWRDGSGGSGEAGSCLQRM